MDAIAGGLLLLAGSDEVRSRFKHIFGGSVWDSYGSGLRLSNWIIFFYPITHYQQNKQPLL